MINKTIIQNIVTTNFHITHDMVKNFAHLTGDYNAMHMDEEIARKSRYRKTIAHGMLSFSFIVSLQNAFHKKQTQFNNFSISFRKPIHIGDKIHLQINYDIGENKFQAEWRKEDSNELLISAKGSFSFVDERKNDAADKGIQQNTFLSETLDENVYMIHDLEGENEELVFCLGLEQKKAFIDNILIPGGYHPAEHHLCNNLATTLLLSTMVGMKLPGRYATFLRLDIDFTNNIKGQSQYVMKANVEKTSTVTETLDATFEINDPNSILGASGKYQAIVNAPPVSMLSSADICKNFQHLGLENKVVLITGASRGIGEVTAKLFGTLGAKVIVNYYRGKNDADSIVADIKSTGGEAIAIQCDITNDDAVQKMFQLILGVYGTIDVLVNNAVKDANPKDISELTWNDYLLELEVSVKGLHACCKEVIPVFKNAGAGKIINLSTIFVDNPVVGQSRYITAKSAVVGYTKSLAKDLVKHNIQANVVVPNMAETDLIASLPSVYRNKIAQSRPYGRHVKPIEVAQSIAFFASSWSDAITGQKIVLNLGEPPFA